MKIKIERKDELIQGKVYRLYEKGMSYPRSDTTRIVYHCKIHEPIMPDEGSGVMMLERQCKYYNPL